MLTTLLAFQRQTEHSQSPEEEDGLADNEGVEEGELRTEGESLALTDYGTTVEEHSQNTLLTIDPCLTLSI